MSGSRRHLPSTLLLVAALLAGAREARGDGGFFVETKTLDQAGTTLEQAVEDESVSSNGQRALLLRAQPDGCWSLLVEPGRVRVPGAAWLLPVPVVPREVALASPTLLSELEAATRPVERRVTNVSTAQEILRGPGEGFFCGMDAGGSGGGDGEGVLTTDTSAGVDDPSVTLFGGGRIGGLEWQTLEAASGEDLVEWLTENGYAVPPALTSVAERYVSEGWAFLATRITRVPDDPDTVPVLRLTLCTPSGWAPTYPMRLTPFSTRGRLEFVLFVADAAHWSFGGVAEPWEKSWHRNPAPTFDTTTGDVHWAHSVGFSGAPCGADTAVAPTADLAEACDWRTRGYAARARATLEEGDIGVILEFAKPLEGTDLARRSGAESAAAAVADIEAAELRALVDSGVRVMRYRGSATALGMARDLVGAMSPTDGSVAERVSGVFVVTCDLCMSPAQARRFDVAEVPAERPGLAGLPLVVLACAGLFLRLRRARRG